MSKKKNTAGDSSPVFAESSPAAAALEGWLKAISDGDIEKMIGLTTKTWLDGHQPEEFLQQFIDMGIKRIKVFDRRAISDVLEIFKMTLWTRKGQKTVQLTVVCEKGVREPSPEGVWGVNPNSWRLMK